MSVALGLSGAFLLCALVCVVPRTYTGDRLWGPIWSVTECRSTAGSKHPLKDGTAG